jgi:hypothetical protein
LLRLWYCGSGFFSVVTITVAGCAGVVVTISGCAAVVVTVAGCAGVTVTVAGCAGVTITVVVVSAAIRFPPRANPPMNIPIANSFFIITSSLFVVDCPCTR